MNERQTLADCHVLLAEDSREIQSLVTLLLKRAGAEVTCAADGKTAVEQALSAEASGRPFDVVLLDTQMPVLDGLAATRKLRSQGYERPIVAMTALADEAARRKCLAAGCDEHIAVPSDPERLISVHAGCVRKARAGKGEKLSRPRREASGKSAPT